MIKVSVDVVSTYETQYNYARATIADKWHTICSGQIKIKKYIDSIDTPFNPRKQNTLFPIRWPWDHKFMQVQNRLIKNILNLTFILIAGQAIVSKALQDLSLGFVLFSLKSASWVSVNGQLLIWHRLNSNITNVLGFVNLWCGDGTVGLASCEISPLNSKSISVE